MPRHRKVADHLHLDLSAERSTGSVRVWTLNPSTVGHALAAFLSYAGMRASQSDASVALDLLDHDLVNARDALSLRHDRVDARRFCVVRWELVSAIDVLAAWAPDVVPPEIWPSGRGSSLLVHARPCRRSFASVAERHFPQE